MADNKNDENYSYTNGFLRLASLEMIFAGGVATLLDATDSLWQRIGIVVAVFILASMGYSHINRGVKQVIETRDLKRDALRKSTYLNR